VYGADEAFVTGSFGGLTPVTEVDGRTISQDVPIKITKKLRRLYQDRIDQAIANHSTDA